MKEIKYCWNCGKKLNKFLDEENKYYCPKDQMDFMINIDSIKITYEK